MAQSPEHCAALSGSGCLPQGLYAPRCHWSTLGLRGSYLRPSRVSLDCLVGGFTTLDQTLSAASVQTGWGSATCCVGSDCLRALLKLVQGRWAEERILDPFKASVMLAQRMAALQSEHPGAASVLASTAPCPAERAPPPHRERRLCAHSPLLALKKPGLELAWGSRQGGGASSFPKVKP